MKLRKILSLILLAIFVFALASCGEIKSNPSETTNTKNTSDGTPVLKFKDAISFDYLHALNGSKVEISGYIATSSPVNGSFIFLMNLPYQSCPFCVPNTSQLANTLEVYPKSSQKFTYTNQAVKVTGTLITSSSENEFFTDDYGYEFNVKIIDAEYHVIPASELSAEYAEWQKIAESGIVDDLYKMFDYVHFLCAWNTYYVQGRDSSTGKVDGYYLWPGDVLQDVQGNGQFSYGYKEGYFDNLTKRLGNLESERTNTLISNVESAKKLASDALSKLESGEYTFETVYIERWDKYDKIYTINDGDELFSEWESLYGQFIGWIAEWEM